MIPSPIQYGSGIISNRSRRLRTIAAVLLVCIVAMAVYGTRVLVPGINRAAAVASRPAPDSAHRVLPGEPAKPAYLNLTQREAQVLRFDVLFVAAYWCVWIVMVLSLLIIAWLDLREVSRSYLDRRRELWSAASLAAADGSPSRSVGESIDMAADSQTEQRLDPPAGA